MKIFINKLIFFFMVSAACTIISCGGGSSGAESPARTIDVSGMYDVIFAFEGETPEPEVWILKQTGNDVTILFGDVPSTGLTVSGSDLIIAWDFYDSDSVHITLNAVLAISGDTISGSGTLTAGEETITVNFDMTRISTSGVVPEFNIPEASITVGEGIEDWDSVATYVTDATGDTSGGTGTDIQSVKIAKDSSRVYLLVKTDAGLSTDHNYNLLLRDTSFQDMVCIMLSYNPGFLQWQVMANDTQTDDTISIDGEVSVSTGYIELSFLYSDVFTPGEKYIVEQLINPNGVDDSVDDTMFIGYTVLIDVSGTYDVTIAGNGESSGPDVWILKQTGNDVAVLWGEAGDMTVSGSNLIIDWEWEEDSSLFTFYAELAIDGDKITGTGTKTGGAASEEISIDMTRTSTSAVVPEFSIPEASITVDGTVSDWYSVATYITDATDDETEGTGTDIESIKIARDNSNVYLLIKTDAQLSTDYKYDLDIHDTSYQDIGGIGFDYDTYSCSWEVYGSASGQIYVLSDGYIELSFPYSGVFTPGQKYVVEQRIGLDGVDGYYSVDEADFIGYTILPVLE